MTLPNRCKQHPFKIFIRELLLNPLKKTIIIHGCILQPMTELGSFQIIYRKEVFAMTTAEKIKKLQESMKHAGVDGYLIPSSDPHMSEYLPTHYEARSWFSGFNGSAGTLAVTADKAALWTDGRYFIQAENQIKGSGIILMRMKEPGVPTVEEWLSAELPSDGVMGMDGMITSMENISLFEKAFQQKRITLKDVDLVTPIWEGRPALPATDAWILDQKYAGKTPSEKLTLVRSALQKEAADAMLVSRLDDNAWLLNLRASDIEFNPFAMSFCMILPKDAFLFIDENRLPESARSYLTGEGVTIRPYTEIIPAIQSIRETVTMLYEASGTSYTLCEAMKSNPKITAKKGTDPIQLLKGVKNETELSSMKNAHIKDGVAMVRFAIELEEKMANHIPVSEVDVDEMMRRHRLEQENCLGESFGTIAAYGANAAMMHYHPTKENHSILEEKGFLLVDCGGQYLDGTTDITRTYALGEPTEEEKDYYTLVLRSHIRMARTVFKAGLPGKNLDIAAREPFWERGLDYRCGTGHGVGFVGGVHEGPQSLNDRNTTPFEEGMTITDEPGIYEEGKIGIRIENELVCKKAFETEYGKFLCFEPITYCPIDTKAVDASKLSWEEVQWLNDYHEMVLQTLTPYLNEKELSWLAKACAPVVK